MFRYKCSLWAAPISLIISSATFAADQTSVQIDEIIVSASPINQNRFDIVQGTSVLSGSDLADALKGSLGETLAKQPGITSTFFGPFSSRPIIRGFDGDRIRILFDGIGSIDASSVSPDHQVGGDGATAERIEVLRGPSTLLYGSSAVGGVVNIIDGRIPSEVPDNGYAGSATAGYATNAREGFVNGSADIAIGDNFVVHADGGWRKSQDYRIKGFASAPGEDEHDHEDEEHEGEEAHEHEHEEEQVEGIVANSGGETSDVTGGFSYIWDRGLFGASVSRFDSLYGSPAPHGHHHEEEHEGDEEEEEHHDEEGEAVRIDLKQTRVDAKGELTQLSGFISGAKVRFSYADYEHTELEGDEIGTVFSNEGWEGRLELIHAPLGVLTGAFGMQYRDRKFSAVGEEAFVPPTDSDQLAGFLVEGAEIGPWRFEGGARIEHTRIRVPSAAASESFTTYALSGAASFGFTEGTRAGVSVAWTERPPTAEELFSNGPHLATNQFEVGDPSLGIEEAVSVEASLRHRSGPFSGSVGVYATWYDNYIYSLATGAEEDELPIFQYRASEAKFTGFELEASWQILARQDFALSIDGVLDYVRATDTGSGQPLPRIPPLEYLLGVDAAWREWSGRIEIEGSVGQSRTALLETSTGAYTFLNAQLAYQPAALDGVRFVVQGQNLTDSSARPHTSFIKDVAPLPGRDVRFYVQATF